MLIRDEIRERVIEIISRRLGISKEILQADCDRNLLSETVGIDAISLTYLYFFIQSEFHIAFSENALDIYRFNSVEGIVNVLEFEMSKYDYCLSPQSMREERSNTK